MDLKQSILQTQILHGALLFGVVLFSGFSFVLHNFLDGGENLMILPSSALYLIVIAAAVMLWLSGVLYKSRVSGMDKNLSLQERLVKFRSAVILRAALVEAASLTVISGYLLSGNIYYLFIAMAPLYFFVQTFPREEGIIDTLKLSYSEVRRLQ